MAYSSITDIRKMISAEDLAILTGDPTGNTIDSERVDYAVTAADAVIDSYINNVYDTPVQAPVPAILVKISAETALVFLNEYHYRDSSLPLTVYSGKNRLFRLLEDIRKGKLTIPGLDYKGAYINISKSQEDRAISNEDLNIFGE